MTSTDRSRRTVLRGVAVLATAGTAVAGAALRGSRTAGAATVDDAFVAESVDVERNDGRIEAVTVAPELTVSWEDFGGGIEYVDVTIAAAIEGESGIDVVRELRADRVDGDAPPAVEGDDFDSVAGTVEFALDRRDLTETGDHVTAEEFADGIGPGDSRTTTVELTLRVDVVGRQDESETTVETATFDVVVANPEGEASAQGRANVEAT